ncbi:hypothetical protein IC608_16530 [Devosia sp. PTR5]|uniref:Uncharacterized protein n=1 Tax=Devosia oryzisoli TaxID=2774138 RepID=A0A927FYE2_9HYPH|nr:hypothetical protein [Devosia oryzisoli]MBD8067078.1 hypothetical protein [Devosia oryzisoli]
MAGFSGGSRQERTVHWLGCSGQVYDLCPESLEAFAMNEDALYLLAKGRNGLWVGSTADLVADPLSRARFRLAMTCADKVFRIGSAAGSGERLSVIHDLEAGEPASELRAQAA